MATVAEVEVLQRQEDNCEKNATAEEKEGAHKLVDIKWLADVALVLLRLARTLEPVPTKSFEVTCRSQLCSEETFIQPKFLTTLSIFNHLFVKLFKVL